MVSRFAIPTRTSSGNRGAQLLGIDGKGLRGHCLLPPRVNQDLAGGDDDTRRMEWWAGLCTFAFGMTLTYASFDFLMSLDPHWYSTIYGVYYFAGCAVGGFSIVLLSVLLLERRHQ